MDKCQDGQVPRWASAKMGKLLVVTAFCLWVLQSPDITAAGACQYPDVHIFLSTVVPCTAPFDLGFFVCVLLNLIVMFSTCLHRHLKDPCIVFL